MQKKFTEDKQNKGTSLICTQLTTISTMSAVIPVFVICNKLSYLKGLSHPKIKRPLKHVLLYGKSFPQAEF